MTEDIVAKIRAVFLRSIAALCGAIAIGTGIREPEVRPAAVLEGLAGDWTIALDSRYVIGNSSSRDGTFTVYELVEGRNARNELTVMSRAVIKEVIESAADEGWILIRTRSGYCWRYATDATGEWECSGEAPAHLVPLVPRLSPPRPSKRVPLIVLGIVLIAATATSFVWRRRDAS